MRKTKEEDMKFKDFKCINQKLIKSIYEMLTNIDDLRKLERIHRFVEYIYISK